MFTESASAFLEHAKLVDHQIGRILWVDEHEDRLFFDVIIPLARMHAKKRNLVICDLNSDVILGNEDCSLILLDAATLKPNELSNFLRPENPSRPCDYLRNCGNPVFIHLRHIGRLTLDHCRYLTCMVDGTFRDSQHSTPDSSQSTRVVLTGNIAEPGFDYIDLGITSRCTIHGIDWSNK